MKKLLFSLLALVALIAPSSALAGPVIVKTEGDASAQKVIVDARQSPKKDSGSGEFYSFVRYNQAPEVGTPSNPDGPGPIGEQGIQIQILGAGALDNVEVQGSCVKTVVAIYNGANANTYTDQPVVRCPLADNPDDTTEEGATYSSTRPIQPWETTSLVFLGSENNDSVHNLTAANYKRKRSGTCTGSGNLENSYNAGLYAYSNGWDSPKPILGLPLEARGYGGHDYFSDASGASQLYGGAGTDTVMGSITGSEVDEYNKDRSCSGHKLPPVEGDLLSSGTGTIGAPDLLEGGNSDDVLFLGVNSSHAIARGGMDVIFDGPGKDYIDLSTRGYGRFGEIGNPDNARDEIFCEPKEDVDVPKNTDNEYYDAEINIDTRQEDGCEDEPADTWAASTPVDPNPTTPTDPTPTEPPVNPTPTEPPVNPTPTEPTTPTLEPIGPPIAVTPPYVPPVEAPKPTFIPPVIEEPPAPGNQATYKALVINVAYTNKGKLSSSTVTKLKKASKALKAASTKNRLVTLYYKGDKSKSDAEKAFKEIKKVTGATFKLKLSKGSKTSTVTYSQRTA